VVLKRGRRGRGGVCDGASSPRQLEVWLRRWRARSSCFKEEEEEEWHVDIVMVRAGSWEMGTIRWECGDVGDGVVTNARHFCKLRWRRSASQSHGLRGEGGLAYCHV
jgi:hypothetical protein